MGVRWRRILQGAAAGFDQVLQQALPQGAQRRRQHAPGRGTDQAGVRPDRLVQCIPEQLDLAQLTKVQQAGTHAVVHVVQVVGDLVGMVRHLGLQAGLAGAAVANRGTRSDQATANTDAAPRANRAMQPPARATVGKNVGLHLSWFVYRGPSDAPVVFDPVQIKAWEDTRSGANSPWAPIWSAPEMPKDGIIPAKVTFSQPGTYVIWGVADDGALTGYDALTVTVTK